MKMPWLSAAPLAPDTFARLRQCAIFECCKWDPQVEDVSTLSATPLILRQSEWDALATLAEQLAAETLEAEAELQRRPELHKELGLPRSVCRALKTAARKGPTLGAARLMRFDFHFTTEGWRISEVNSDVPGGFNEASGFTRLMAEHFPSAATAGDPTARLAETIAATTGPGAVVALAHATAFIDDRQVMVFLARQLEVRGLRPVLLSPDHLRWQNGFASVAGDWFAGPVDFVFRFYPAEWLPNLPRACGWRHFFAEGKTPVSNPAGALLTQSKRFPLVWNRLATALPAWRRVLPETRDPRDAPWRGSNDWVLKPACGRVGELVGLPGVTAEKEWRVIEKDVRRNPEYWVAQRRFIAQPMRASNGSELYPCVGVFTVDGSVAGAYGRASVRPLINHLAQDVAVLIAAEEPAAIEYPFEPKHEPLAIV